MRRSNLFGGIQCTDSFNSTESVGHDGDARHWQAGDGQRDPLMFPGKDPDISGQAQSDERDAEFACQPMYAHHPDRDDKHLWTHDVL